MTSNSKDRKRQEEAVRSQCNHIVGYRHGMNDARLVEAEELAEGFEPDRLFKFCPKCGEKL
jgi:hypothetical protein